jgi:hypothetical protein
MAKPFIFGYHRRQFRLSRTHVMSIPREDLVAARKHVGQPLARDFRRALGADGRSVLSVREFAGNDAIGEKTRDVPSVTRAYEVKG